MDNNAKTALITGANSGIGFEAAAQLAENGYGKVILVSRTLAKADTARKQLEERTGKKVFDILAADLSETEPAADAAEELAARGDTIDLLILNAGMSPGDTPMFNADGIELTFASTLVGHHVLTMRLLVVSLATLAMASSSQCNSWGKVKVPSRQPPAPHHLDSPELMIVPSGYQREMDTCSPA